MCQDGSCSDVNTMVQGTFANGDPALACAGTSVVVQDELPKSPLCEIVDTIKDSESE